LKSRSLLFLPLGILLPGGAAALEKCVDANGKISYLDVCPAGSTRAPSRTDPQLIPKVAPGTVITRPERELEIKPTPPPAPGERPPAVVVKPVPPPPPPPPAAVTAATPKDVQVSWYDIEGSDHPSLLSSLNARGAQLGQSSWKLSYSYVPRRGKDACAVASVSTKLELAVTLPRWTPPQGTPQDLIGRWERFLKTLLSHQNARLEHARELERAVASALTGLPPAADCAALDAAVRERYAALERDTQSRAEPAGELVFE
jgi:predicted secreted Zn-dependent protease